MTEPRTVGVEDFAAFIDARDRFVFTTHMTPDGDGLGSELALCRFLRGRGKDVRIINCSSVPEDLRFLVRTGEVITFQKGRHESELRDAGAVVAFDLGGAGRLGRMEECVRASGGAKALLDHHIFENDLFDTLYVDTQVSSSAELTYRLIQRMGGRIDHSLAEPLYIGLVQDTGSFNYNSTSPFVHRMAAEFLEAGVDPYRIWKKIACQKPFGRVRLLGLSLSRIEMLAQGRVAGVDIDLDYLRNNGGEVRDAFEVVNHFLTIRGVEIGVLALQIGTKKVKFSMRSSGRHDVHAIAAEFGGGGHRFAAGFTVEGHEVSDIYREILNRAVDLVHGHDVGNGDHDGD